MHRFSCSDCKYFYQHYVSLENGYMDCNCGHCIYPMLKHRSPYTLACKHFIFKCPDPIGQDIL